MFLMLGAYCVAYSCEMLAEDPMPVVQTATVLESFLGLKSCTLKNGIKVVVCEHHRAPVVMLFTCICVGSADESYGKTGLAHFLEHLGFGGTPAAPRGTFERSMDACGVQWNAFTSYDLTVFMELMPKEHLESCMQFEADRLAHLTIASEFFEKERQVVLEEIKIGDSSDSKVLNSRAQGTLLTNHPYGRQIAGFSHDVAKLSLEDIHQFRRTYYTPQNTIIVITGDITLEEARGLAEKYYGSLTGPEPPARQWPKCEPHRNEEVRIVKYSDQTQHPVLTFYWRVPSLHDDQKRAAAIALLGKWLGQGRTSYLYRKLVEENAIASSIECTAEVDMREGYMLTIQAIPCPKVSIQTLEKRLREQLALCATENNDPLRGITEKDLKGVQQKFAATIPFIKDDFKQSSFLVATMLCAGYSLEFIEKYPTLWNDVSLSDFRAAAREIGTPPEVVTMLLPIEGKR
jgi:zinc protease